MKMYLGTTNSFQVQPNIEIKQYLIIITGSPAVGLFVWDLPLLKNGEVGTVS